MSQTEVGDRIIVSFIDQPEEARFDGDHWPYHVTLLPWYRIDSEKLAEWEEQLADIAGSTERFKAGAGPEDYFGTHQEKPRLVRRLGEAAFRPLHYRLLNTLTAEKSSINGQVIGSFVGRRYEPHITQKYEDLLPEGQELSIASFSEVIKIDRDELGNSREIIGTYPFK